MDNEDWVNAIFNFEQTLKVMKRHVQSYGNLGICYAKIGEKKKALIALDKALLIDRTYMPAIQNKMIIALLKEGEKLDSPSRTENYYVDKIKKERG